MLDRLLHAALPARRQQITAASGTSTAEATARLRAWQRLQADAANSEQEKPRAMTE